MRVIARPHQLEDEKPGEPHFCDNWNGMQFERKFANHGWCGFAEPGSNRR